MAKLSVTIQGKGLYKYTLVEEGLKLLYAQAFRFTDAGKVDYIEPVGNITVTCPDDGYYSGKTLIVSWNYNPEDES